MAFSPPLFVKVAAAVGLWPPPLPVAVDVEVKVEAELVLSPPPWAEVKVRVTEGSV